MGCRNFAGTGIAIVPHSFRTKRGFLFSFFLVWSVQLSLAWTLHVPATNTSCSWLESPELVRANHNALLWAPRTWCACSVAPGQDYIYLARRLFLPEGLGSS